MKVEEDEIKNKIVYYKGELEELKEKYELLEEENLIMIEQKERCEELLKQKQAEKKLKEKMILHAGDKNSKYNKDDFNDAERREKELDDLLKYKVLDLLMGEEDRAISNRLTEYEKNSLMIINYVEVQFVPELLDGDQDSLDKADPCEA